jgi:L-2-hydroxyglutarate oxidase
LFTKKFDFLIIGAGIVGLAVAKQLTECFPHATVAIIEKEGQIGKHASGRNSGVLHSGIYYPPHSIKAKVCRDGAKQMLAFAKEHRIRHRIGGKIILAAHPKEFPTLDHLLKNALEHNIEAHLIDEQTIKEIEPHASGSRGIYIPATANIDSPALLTALSELIKQRGAALFLNEKVIKISHEPRAIQTAKQLFQYGYLFNCAGAYTDHLAKLFGLAKNYRLLPFKGMYYKLKPEKNNLINNNIYPVPDLNLPFLGVHFTKNINNEVYIGPTAMPAFGRENYGGLQGFSMESPRIMKDLAMMYLANHQHFRKLIHSEVKKYTKNYFLHHANKLVKNLHSNDLMTCNKVGIRPQLINIQTKQLEMDYIIEQNSHSLHILNAISPAFTSAFSFAELLVKKALNFK